jgi:hypothetical protein
LLSNGGVLITGGLLGSGALTSAEVYDSVSRTWNATTNLGAARYLHTATLHQRQVLVGDTATSARRRGTVLTDTGIEGFLRGCGEVRM